MLHRRYAPPRLMATLTRDEAAKRFAELPLPSTADEHWRFTDLRGFDPEEVSDTVPVSDTKPAMLDLDVAGRARRHRERDRDRLARPRASRFEPLPRGLPRRS